MKLNSDMVERTLSQIDALEVSEDNPLVHELKTMFGDHTFFLNSNGLNFIEPLKEMPQKGTLVNVANWDGTNQRNLIVHKPELTDVVVELGPTH